MNIGAAMRPSTGNGSSDWQPDLVIVMRGINELIGSFSPATFVVGEHDDLWTRFHGPSIQDAKLPTFGRYSCERYLKCVISPPSSRWHSGRESRQVDYREHGKRLLAEEGATEMVRQDLVSHTIGRSKAFEGGSAA